MYEYTEQNNIENPTIELFQELGYDFENAFYDKAGPHSILHRKNENEVILTKYLRPALKELNRKILAPIASQAESIIDQAINTLKQDRSDRLAAEANHEVYQIL